MLNNYLYSGIKKKYIWEKTFWSSRSGKRLENADTSEGQIKWSSTLENLTTYQILFLFFLSMTANQFSGVREVLAASVFILLFEITLS